MTVSPISKSFPFSGSGSVTVHFGLGRLFWLLSLESLVIALGFLKDLDRRACCFREGGACNASHRPQNILKELHVTCERNKHTSNKAPGVSLGYVTKLQLR